MLQLLWFLMVIPVVITFVCVGGESKLRDRGPLASLDRQVCPNDASGR